MNRKTIKASLRDYKESLTQQAAILKDKEIQGLFEQENDQQARSLIEKRYPLGRWEVVNKNRIKLIEVITQGMPGWKDISAEDVLCSDVSVFDDLVKLAERV